MPQPDEERRLGELLVATTRLSREELQAALLAQRQQGGPNCKTLAEVLVERGHVTALELQQANLPSEQPAPPEQRASAAPLPAPAGSPPLPEEVRLAMLNEKHRVGRYVLLSTLGRGGMGVVYRSYDTQLQREVAIKMIATESADQDQLARFLREARACAGLNHPSILEIHDVGEHGSRPYLVMDLVDGRNLEDILNSEGMPIRDLVSTVADVARALDHAHSAGIIHRDVKPDNIMLSDDGQTLLMDFGLARETSAKQQLTRTGQIMGTPVYMAPEQIQTSDMGPGTDIYALGTVLYRGLTGSPPFIRESTIALFRAILLDVPQPLLHINPDIPIDLETITLKCLEKEPHRRYASAAALADELQRFLEGQPILAHPISPSEKAIRWVRRNRSLAGALATVVVVVTGTSMLLVGQASMARQEKKELLQNAEREKEQARQENLEALRREVTALLQKVRSGEALADPSNFEAEQRTLARLRGPEAVQQLIDELDALSNRLSLSQSMSAQKERFLRFLCEALGVMGERQDSVAALGRYLKVELALPTAKRDQLRAVPAGKVLCLLDSPEADRLLLESRDGFGTRGAFWGQVQRSYRRVSAEPLLEAETASGYVKRGISRAAKGDFDGAIADYTHAIELEPNHVKAWTQLGRTRASKGELDDAISDYSRAIELDPGHTLAWSSRGTARQEKGDIDGAIEDLTRAIEIDPNQTEAWNNRGNLRKAEGNLKGAIADYTRAIEIDPSIAWHWSNRGSARSDSGNHQGANADLSQAIEIDPSEPKHRFNRGNIRQFLPDFDGAIEDYTHALEIDPNLKEAWTNRGIARVHRGDIDGAIGDYTRAIAIDPNYAGAWANRGGARQKKGDLDGAIDDSTRAIEIDPNLAVAWGVRALTRQKNGDIDGAIEDLEQFLKMSPDHPKAPDIRAMARKLRQQQARTGAGK